MSAATAQAESEGMGYYPLARVKELEREGERLRATNLRLSQSLEQACNLLDRFTHTGKDLDLRADVLSFLNAQP